MNQNAPRTPSSAPPTTSHVHSSSVESGSTIGAILDDDFQKESGIWSGTTDSPGTASPRLDKDLDEVDEDSDVDEHERLLHDSAGIERVASSLAKDDDEPPSKPKDEPVTWRSLPRKDQLFLLMLARISEPLTQTSLQSYMYYQLQSFDPSLPDSAISTQVGIMQAAFTLTQFLTAFLWGKVADSPRVGRKKVLVTGLLGTGLSAVGFGFSRSFLTAMLFRSLGGALNGNVGVMRTMIAEIIKEKKYQSRAFMIMPMTFNIAVIIGPTIGGFLAEPVKAHPGLFGKNSVFGGRDGVWWMEHWPYALPNVISAAFLLAASLLITVGLEETHYMRRDKRDWGRELGSWIAYRVFRRKASRAYDSMPSDEPDTAATTDRDIEMQSAAAYPSPTRRRVEKRAKLPFRRIWTRNVIFTFLTHGLMAFHVGTYLFSPRRCFSFLLISTQGHSTTCCSSSSPLPASTPRTQILHPPSSSNSLSDSQAASPCPRQRSACRSPSSVSLASRSSSPCTHERRGGTARRNATASRSRYSPLPTSSPPISRCSLPQPSRQTPPLASPSGRESHCCCSSRFLRGLLRCLARSFLVSRQKYPLKVRLWRKLMRPTVNNCSPHPSVLGTVHGLAQSVSSGARTIGPVIGGWLFGRGLSIGVIGLAWWAFCLEALVGAISGMFVREGSGHEILLDGEEIVALPEQRPR